MAAGRAVWSLGSGVKAIALAPPGIHLVLDDLYRDTDLAAP
jgi:hypothetical protein